MPSSVRYDFSGRTVLVTGASSGIGAAIAQAFGAAGAHVGLNYRSDDEGAGAVAERIERDGGEAALLKGDVSDQQAVADVFARFLDRFARLDILVANAGIQKDRRLLDMDAKAWRQVIDVNLTGQFLCIREAVAQFCRQEPPPDSPFRGTVVCMSSVHDRIPWAGHVNYAASKGGVQLLMKSVAQEVAEDGIRVNAIAPGAIKTEINREEWESEEGRRQMRAHIPYGRIGEPEDIAKAALWLASDDADYVTGTTLYVDGGMILYPSFREGG